MLRAAQDDTKRFRSTGLVQVGSLLGVQFPEVPESARVMPSSTGRCHWRLQPCASTPDAWQQLETPECIPSVVCIDVAPPLLPRQNHYGSISFSAQLIRRTLPCLLIVQRSLLALDTRMCLKFRAGSSGALQHLRNVRCLICWQRTRLEGPDSRYRPVF